MPEASLASVHVSGVAGAGSHFSMAFATTDAVACVWAEAKVVRVAVAETAALAGTTTLPPRVAVVFDDVDRITCVKAAAGFNATPLADAAPTTVAAVAASFSLSALATTDVDADTATGDRLTVTTCADAAAAAAQDAETVFTRIAFADVDAAQSVKADA